MASLVTVGTCGSCFSLPLFYISEMLTSGVTRCLTQSSSGGARQAQSGSEKMVLSCFWLLHHGALRKAWKSMHCVPRRCSEHAGVMVRPAEFGMFG